MQYRGADKHLHTHIVLDCISPLLVWKVGHCTEMLHISSCINISVPMCLFIHLVLCICVLLFFSPCDQSANKLWGHILSTHLFRNNISVLLIFLGVIFKFEFPEEGVGTCLVLWLISHGGTSLGHSIIKYNILSLETLAFENFGSSLLFFFNWLHFVGWFFFLISKQVLASNLSWWVVTLGLFSLFCRWTRSWTEMSESHCCGQ